jgi:hypothetical protein
MAAKDIHEEMLPMYGEHCLSHQAVQKFSESRQVSKTNIESVGWWGSPRRQRCSASKTSSEQTGGSPSTPQIIYIDAVATAIGCSHGQAYNMMHERLGFHKACSRWVPRQLTPQHKSQRMGLSLHLQRYQDEGEDMHSQIVTGAPL